MDDIDKKILKLLVENSKLTNKEIGEQVYLTGQSVGQRIINLQERKIIENYTINVNYDIKQFIRIFMEGNHFLNLEKEVNHFKQIEEFYKVSGQACYIVVAHFTLNTLNEFIESISKYARCSVDTVVSNKKK